VITIQQCVKEYQTCQKQGPVPPPGTETKQMPHDGNRTMNVVAAPVLLH